LLHYIKNNKLTCTINSIGAEIRSLKNITTGEEYIWQINPKIWGSSSPILFPAIGNIKGNKVIHKGQEYAMPKHGIVRGNDSLVFNQISESECSFTLNSSDITKSQYPFDFVFSVNYKLDDNRLIMTYNIKNEDNEPMYFICGGHSAYSLPLNKSTALSDYLIEFPKQNQLVSATLGDSGLLSYRKRNYDLLNNSLELNEIIFKDDALIFSNINFDWVRLKKKNEEKGIAVRFYGYPNLALWAKPGADYICIEPWLGLPDKVDESIEISKKTTYQKLNPMDRFTISIETEIE
jgi:galactose mutarotase-like enzyme